MVSCSIEKQILTSVSIYCVEIHTVVVNKEKGEELGFDSSWKMFEAEDDKEMREIRSRHVNQKQML